MTWKVRDKAIKCPKCKTDKKFTVMYSSGQPVLHCHGCNDQISSPVFTLLVQFGGQEGAKQLKRELRGLLGMASMEDIRRLDEQKQDDDRSLSEKRS